MIDNETSKIKIGNRYWLSDIGGLIMFLGIAFIVVMFALLSINKYLSLEIKYISYYELIDRYILHGFGISIITSIIGIWLSKRRVWKNTDLIIKSDRLEFSNYNRTITLPKHRILKLVLLKSYLTKDNKVRVTTNGLKEYIFRMNNNAYNKLIDIFPDRFYQE